MSYLTFPLQEIKIGSDLMSRALRLQSQVEQGMLGRIGDPGRPVASIAACFAVMAGHGDHCEIGVLWGGSAILTALLKKEHGLAGKVICIDPLDGYYMGVEARGQEEFFNLSNDKLQVPVSVETLIENARRFGVLDQLEIVAARSDPWPEVLEERKFVSAFIDGNHWGDAPYRDWLNLKNRTSAYIVFDNFDDGSSWGIPDVRSAVMRIIGETKSHQWRARFEDGPVVAFATEKEWS